jgi:hypothetical protein
MLTIRRHQILEFLHAQNQPFRIDASNASTNYQRNRLRSLLSSHSNLIHPLLEMSGAFAELRLWIDSAAPKLASCFATNALADLPPLLARHVARTWLISQGCPPEDLIPAVIDRLLEMTTDASTPPRQHFPGSLPVRRKAARIGVSP